MAKRVLTDNSGSWFDDEKAVRFAEASVHDGNNYISRATGSQWEHQALYYTRSNSWILNHWSAWQGTTESYERIDEAQAMRWLVSQECWGDEGIADLPTKVQARVKESIVQSEI